MATTGAFLPADKPDMTAKQRYWLGHTKACVAGDHFRPMPLNIISP